MKRFPVTFLCVAFAGFLGVARANDAQIVYYDISARTGSELMQETNTKGPIGPDGKRYPAYTHWRVDWNYTYQFTPGTCKLVKLTATVSGTITLPRWVDSGDASRSLVQSWDAMVAALRAHENGHYAHGIAAAQEIEALQDSVGSAADCPSLEKEINAQGKAIVDKYSALDVKYDEDTKHGQTQGAVLNYSN